MNSNLALPVAPKSINLAALSYLLSAVVPLVWSVVLIAGGDYPVPEGVAPEQADLLMKMSAVFSVVPLLLYLWLVVKLRGGRGWARIVLAIFAVLHVAALFGPAAGAAEYIGLALSLAGLVLSFLPESNRYVVDVKAVR
ncbi:hypothetical protein ABZ805_09895 [Saccharopolyspora sp. NPDC047091]|uniref:hypothetical protein n=1 Tax=Saccharopolyspora sp. NPDC047091 TaxID=3155924 RepID=UPI0033CA6BFB